MFSGSEKVVELDIVTTRRFLVERVSCEFGVVYVCFLCHMELF